MLQIHFELEMPTIIVIACFIALSFIEFSTNQREDPPPAKKESDYSLYRYTSFIALV